MKCIGVFSNAFQPVINRTKLHGDPLHFRIARAELLASITDAGGYACMVGGFANYKGNGVFARHWVLRPDDSLCYDERGEITIDVVYDKDKFKADDVKILNPPSVAEICENKAATYELFSAYQPYSRLAHSLTELHAALDDIEAKGGNLAVVKGIVSNGGTQVVIDKVARLRHCDLPQFPLLVQQFIDASGGVPDIAKGLHDVRLIILGGELIAASVREPKPGSYLSNTKQGGVLRGLDLADVPPALRQRAASIDSRLPQLPRLYSADFMYDAGQDTWFLVELNARPGQMAKYQGVAGERFISKLTHYLLEM